jgi:hypothetical protein
MSKTVIAVAKGTVVTAVTLVLAAITTLALGAMSPHAA